MPAPRISWGSPCHKDVYARKIQHFLRRPTEPIAGGVTKDTAAGTAFFSCERRVVARISRWRRLLGRIGARGGRRIRLLHHFAECDAVYEANDENLKDIVTPNSRQIVVGKYYHTALRKAATRCDPSEPNESAIFRKATV